MLLLLFSCFDTFLRVRLEAANRRMDAVALITDPPSLARFVDKAMIGVFVYHPTYKHQHLTFL